MSHATYLFLLDIQDLNADLLTPGAHDEDLLQETLDRYEVAFDKQTDGNNWHRPIELKFRDRPSVLAKGIDDDRSAHEILEEQANSVQLFEKAIAESWLYNAREFAFDVQGMNPPNLPIFDHKKARDEFQECLKRQLQTWHQDPASLPANGQGDGQMARYLTNRVKRGVSFAGMCRVGGFTKSKRATPYNWRAFDLRSDAKATPNAILYLDIHT